MVVAAHEAQRLGDVGRPRPRLVTIEGPRSRSSISVPARLRLWASSPIWSIWVRIPVTSTGPAVAARPPEQRPQHVGHPAQPLEHLGSVGAVPQHLAEPLVERAERTPAAGGVLEHPHPHRRRYHPGHRPDRGAVVARLERDRGAGLERATASSGSSTRPSSAAAPEERAAQWSGRAAQSIGGPGVQELAALQAQQLGRRRDVDQGRGRRAPRPAHARWRRGAAGRRRRSPGRTRCPASAGASRRSVTCTAWPATASASRSAPTLTTWVGVASGVLIGRPPRSVTARRVAPALDRCTSAPASASAATWRSSPCGSAAVPTTLTTTGTSPPIAGDRGRQALGGVGLGAVAEHHVHQHHRRRPGRPPAEPVSSRRVGSIIGCARPRV